MNTEREHKEAPAEVEAPGKKLTRTQRRQLERMTNKIEKKKLKQLRLTPEYHRAKKAIAEFHQKKKANQPGSPQR